MSNSGSSSHNSPKESGTTFSAAGSSAPSTAKEEAKSTASNLADKAGDMASDAGASISKMTSGIAGSLRDGVEAQKNAGADAVASLARSARDAASGIEDTSPQVARLVRTSADAVEKATQDLRTQSLGELVDSVGQFAVRQPVAFFGCGVLAGLVLSRLLMTPNR